MSMRLRDLAITLSLLVFASPAAAQTFEIVGTRAAGMGGAFVAVADDSSATYWNPAGLALGHLFSAVFDRKLSDLEPDTPDALSRQESGSLISLGVPALGFSYYQLRTVSVTPAGTTIVRSPQGGESLTGLVRLDKLTTQHAGVTLVQSLVQGVAIATTLKIVHGNVATATELDGNRDERLDEASDLATKGTSKFDADLGFIAGSGRVKVGLTVRNLREPSFRINDTSSDPSDVVRIRRQARAGLAVSVSDGWAVATDFDLTKNGPPEAAIRSFAAGTEGRLTRKIFVRSGFRLSTTADARPGVSAGGSYAVLSAIWIDGQATWGSEKADRGWGIAARVLY